MWPGAAASGTRRSVQRMLEPGFTAVTRTAQKPPDAALRKRLARQKKSGPGAR